MKKLFILATAAVALASCSDSDLVGNIASSQQTEQPQAVEFGTYMGSSATRTYGDGFYTGGQITNGNYTGAANSHSLKDAEFGVFAYYTGTDAFATWKTAGTGGVYTSAPNFMYNQRITWDDTHKYWTYDPVKYWPNGIDNANAAGAPSNTATEKDSQQKVSFFAYAPYTAALTTTANCTNKPEASHVSSVITKIVSNAVDAGQATGIVAMSKNTETADIQLKYVLDAASEATAVDMLWGLRSVNTYKDADGTDNTEATLGDVYNVDLTKQTVEEKVGFLFKHALAKVGGNTSSTTSASGNAISGLKVKVDVDANDADKQTSYLGSSFNNAKTLVTIKSVKIRDKYTYTHEDSDDSNNENSDFLNWGWFDIVTGDWTRTGTDVSLTTDSKGSIYSVTANNNPGSGEFNLNKDIKEPTAAVTNPNASTWSISGTTGVTTTAKDVYLATEQVPGLLLIPGASGSNTLYVTVDYIVRTADENLSTGFTQVEQTITNKVTLNNDILDPNKVYTLIMHLGLTSVKFEAIVADWSLNGGNYTEGGSETGGTGDQTTKVWLPSNVVAYKANEEVAGAATQANITISNIGNYKSYTVDTNSDISTGSDNVTGNGTAVTVKFTGANNTTTNNVNVVTIVGELGKVTVTLTHKAAAITIGNLAEGKVEVTGPSDLNLSPATITVNNGTADMEYAATADETHYSYDNSAKTITIPTAAGTYTITVTQNDATATKNVEVVVAP